MEAGAKYRFGIIIVSSTRTPDSDLSGKLAQEFIAAHGHSLELYMIVKDELYRIREALRDALKSNLDCIIFCGGTGFSPDDLTIEAISPLIQKQIPGFGELFRQRSLARIGESAMVTRALGGICCGIPVFCLPGSPNGMSTGLELILDQIGHLILHLKGKKHEPLVS